jgi:hypothetical protein
MLQVANFGDDRNAASPWSDAQVPSAQCGNVLGLNSMQTPSAISLSQGNTFTDMWSANRQSGGRRNRKNRSHKKRMNRSRKGSRKGSRKNRTNKHRKQRGGAAAFPDVFGTTLDANLREAAGVDKIDTAFAQLPQFVGSYGTQVGGRRNTRANRKASRKGNRKNRKASRKNRKASRKNKKSSRKNRKASRKNRKGSRKANRKQRGGAWADQFASVNAPSNLMPKDMYAYAHTNPQFYNENVVNPNFSGPSNSYGN